MPKRSLKNKHKGMVLRKIYIPDYTNAFLVKEAKKRHMKTNDFIVDLMFTSASVGSLLEQYSVK